MLMPFISGRNKGNINGHQRTGIELVAATLILIVPALINGYPLVYPDTGTYLQQAIELHGVPDRPPYYSFLILAVHLKLSLWPVILMQSLAVATALRLIVSTITPSALGLGYLAIVVGLVALTSIGWHADQIMPDVFTGLLPILVFMIAWAWSDLRRMTRVALVIAACGVTTLHYTHLPLAIGLFAVATIVRLSQGVGWREARRVAVIGVVVSTVASGAFLTYSVALIHRPVLSPNGSIFLAARVLADGPGRDWLAESCPGSGNPFCKYRERVPQNSAVFLWDRSSPLQDVLRDVGPEQTRRAATQIVAGAIAIRPTAQLADALANAGTQLIDFGALDTECPEHCGEDEAVSRTIRRHFGREYQQFRASLQMAGRLPVAAIRYVQAKVVTLALIAAIVLLGLAVLCGDRLTSAFMVLVVATLALNAVFCGAMSGPLNRYQSRVIWLLPLCALLGAFRLRRSASFGRSIPLTQTFPHSRTINRNS
jgi:hypothetical protein